MRQGITKAIIAAVALVAAAGSAVAQEGDPNFKVAYVRLDYVLEECERIKEKVEKLEQEYQAARNELLAEYKRAQETIKTTQTRYELASTPEQRKAYRDEIAALDQQLRESRATREALLEQKKRNLLEPEVDELQKVIQQIGKERGFDLIFDEADIAYGAREFDISRDVLVRFEETPPGTIKPVESAAAGE